MKIFKWLLLALQFLTIIPTVPFRDVDDRDMRYSVMFFPAIGLLLGAVVWLVMKAAALIFAPGIAAFFALAALTLLTGLLHLDGVMDVADALGSRKGKEDALAIMKDSHVGAIGAGAGMLLLLGKFVALSDLSVAHIGYFLVPPMFSRLGMIWIMVVSPSARTSGLSGFYAQKIPVAALVVASVYALIAVFWWLNWQFALIDIGSLVGTVGVYQYLMKKKFGGMTGDMYGAFNELMEWVLFTLGAMR